jgi:alpha-N-acetylglucosamine transferase
MDVKPIYVSDAEGTPIWWAFKLSVQGGEGYIRSFSKLELWKLEQYEKIIYIDNDIYIKGSYQKLFELTDGHEFAAVQDDKIGDYVSNIPHGRMNYFNAGMFVMTPNSKVFANMMELLSGENREENLKIWNHGYAEQDFLNFYFGAGWKRLPRQYNLSWIGSRTSNEILVAVGLHHKYPDDRAPNDSLQQMMQDDFDNAKKLLIQ